MSYCELWTVLLSWKKQFSTKEFSSTFASPYPNKVLHDMTKKGLFEKIGFGIYRVNTPEEYVAKKTNTFAAYNLLKEAEMPYALTGPDAVFFWTKGGYQVDRFFGFYPIHLKVEIQDLIKWKKFFSSKGRKSYVYEQTHRNTLFGIFYMLLPQKKFNFNEIDGFCVSPLAETVNFCQRNIYSYEPALEMLDELYSLELNERYMEAKTNV